MKKPRHSKVRKLTPNHTARKWEGQKSIPGNVTHTSPHKPLWHQGSCGREEEWMVQGGKGCEDWAIGWKGKGEPTRKLRLPRWATRKPVRFAELAPSSEEQVAGDSVEWPQQLGTRWVWGAPWTFRWISKQATNEALLYSWERSWRETRELAVVGIMLRSCRLIV